MAIETVTYQIVVRYTQGFDTEDVNLVEAYTEFKAKRKAQLTGHLPATGGTMKAELISVSES